MKKNVVVSFVLAGLGGVLGFVTEQVFNGSIEIIPRRKDEDEDDDDKPRMKDVTEDEHFTEEDVEVEDKK